MRKIVKTLGLAVTLAAVLVFALAGVVTADSGPMGPAPNSGDGISDGSGFDGPNGLIGGNGPAPNSGDGIPDGSGF